MSTSKKPIHKPIPPLKPPSRNPLHQLHHQLRQRIRKAVPEETAGGVVFRRTERGVEILMIQDARGRWTVPKGHIEPGEDARTAAEREVQEEAGLEQVKALDYLGKTHFRYRREDKLILMTQHMFLVQALGDNGKLVKEEWMKGINWFPAMDALEAIEYDDIGKLFLLALKKIRHGKY